MLVLGRSLSEFMRALGVYRQQRRERKHTKSPQSNEATLLVAQRLVRSMRTSVATRNNRKLAVIADLAPMFWWHPQAPQRADRCGRARFELSEKFFNEIISHPVPLDLNTLTALKRSSPWALICTYGWSIAPSPLRAPLRLTWRQVYRQFGANPAQGE